MVQVPSSVSDEVARQEFFYQEFRNHPSVARSAVELLTYARDDCGITTGISYLGLNGYQGGIDSSGVGGLFGGGSGTSGVVPTSSAGSHDRATYDVAAPAFDNGCRTMIELLLIAAVIALSPIPVVSFILVLAAAGGVRNGAGYLVGWFASFVVVIIVTVDFTGGEPVRSSTVPQTVGSVVLIVVGLGMLVTAWRWSLRPAREAPKSPTWMARLDHIGPLGSAAAGALLSRGR